MSELAHYSIRHAHVPTVPQCSEEVVNAVTIDSLTFAIFSIVFD